MTAWMWGLALVGVWAVFIAGLLLFMKGATMGDDKDA